MAQSTEDYLDSLLRQAMGIPDPEYSGKRLFHDLRLFRVHADRLDCLRDQGSAACTVPRQGVYHHPRLLFQAGRYAHASPQGPCGQGP